MARRGGFPGGGIPGSANNMIRQMQRVQRQAEEAKKALDEKEFSAATGGGAVEVKMNGKKELLSLKISKEAVDPEDVEMLEDMIVAAFNDCLHQVDAETERMFGGMGL